MVDVAAPRRILELMFLTAWADGRLEGSEAIAIHKIAAHYPLLRGVGATEEIDVQARRRLERLGLDVCVREAAEAIVDPAHRELAFQCCAKVSGSDGVYLPQEAQVLQLLRKVWGFSPEQVERLLVLATR